MATHTTTNRPEARRAPGIDAAIPATELYCGYATALGGMIEALYAQGTDRARVYPKEAAFRKGVEEAAYVLLAALNDGGYTLAERCHWNAETIVIRESDGEEFRADEVSL